MQMYEYACPNCGTRCSSDFRGDRLDTSCHRCEFRGPLHRKFSISHPRPLEPHFNHSVGKVVTSNRQFDQLLKQRSDEMTQYTGIPHDLQRVDMDDPKSLGVTREGLDEERYARRGVDLDKFDFADSRKDDAHRDAANVKVNPKRVGGAGEAPREFNPADYL